MSRDKAPEYVQGCWECLHDQADHIDSFGECMVGWEPSDPAPACQCVKVENPVATPVTPEGGEPE